MTFNYQEIDTLDYFDSRDVVERLNEINAEIAKYVGDYPPNKLEEQ